MLAARTRTWPSPAAYIFLMFATRSMPFSPRSSSRPRKGETYTGCFDRFVAAYTAAACCCEKQRVILTRIPWSTDISAARSPSWVHGYLTYALGTQENISLPCANISSAVLLKSENTSIDTPASPTNGEIVCTIFLYSSSSSREVNLWPDETSLRTSGFFDMRVGLVV